LANTAAILPRFRPEAAPTFRAYTIRLPRRDEVYQKLREAGLEVVIHYAPPISQHPVYRRRLRGADALPITERVAGELLCLPVAPELTMDDAAFVVQTLRGLLV
jgi:dTDP-4-amino-4,6-dideoxygalactose transaminase